MESQGLGRSIPRGQLTVLRMVEPRQREQPVVEERDPGRSKGRGRGSKRHRR